MKDFLSYYLPLFLVGHLIITFVIPSVRVYRQTGINPVTFGRRDNAHDYIGAVMKLLTGGLVIAVLLFSFFPKGYIYLNPFDYLENKGMQITGLIIIHVALIWIVVAQQHMKQSWRIGIDEKHQTALITKGLFSLSRNPVFLGMILSTVGIFLILPNALTFFVVLASYLIIQVQIRLEEAHLLQQHGSLYQAYRDKVRRLI